MEIKISFSYMGHMGENPENPAWEKLLEQGWETSPNSDHVWPLEQESNPTHSSGKPASLSLKISDVISYILEKKFIQRASAGQSGPKLTGTGRNKVQFRDSQGGGFKNCKDAI